MGTQYKGRALITGASTGIGAVYADRLARRGYDLVLTARDKQRLQAVAKRVAGETGRNVNVVVADLTSKADLAGIEALLLADSSITAFVNNAGINMSGALSELDVDVFEIMVQLNVVALTRLLRAAVPGFVARGNGIIVNMASMLALIPEMLNGAYSGTKAYVINLTRSLQNEVGAKGVQVQAVLPGAVSTEFWGRAGFDLQNFPKEIVMSAEEVVDAALAGLDQHELITIPSLPDAKDWAKYLEAEAAMRPNLSLEHAAERYKKPLLKAV